VTEKAGQLIPEPDSALRQKFIAFQPTLETELGEKVSLNRIAREFLVFQRLIGHRHSIDDALTGWYALQKQPHVQRMLDLGSGIGTVGLTVLSGLDSKTKALFIEAQDISFKLLSANIACNALENRVSLIHSDLRVAKTLEKFPLITGSPPYFPINSGVLPPDSQKAHARFELRGHVGDYAAFAHEHLEDSGLFVFCFPFQQKARCFNLVTAAGMSIISVRDVVPRAGKAPLFSLYSAKKSADVAISEKLVEEPAFIVADANGVYSDEMIAMQASRGFGPDGSN